MTIIFLIGSLVVLKYYHDKKYWIAYTTGIISTLTILYFYILIYSIIVGRIAGSYYASTYLIALGTAIPYEISLIFSKTGKRPWLKTAGIFGFIFELILISTFIGYMNAQDVDIKDTMEDIHKWTSLAGILIPLLFIMNFWSELRILKADNVRRTRQETWKYIMLLAGTMALSASLFLGLRLVSESQEALNQLNNVTERAENLAQPFEARTYVNSQNNTNNIEDNISLRQ
jgi:hypothetical protein